MPPKQSSPLPIVVLISGEGSNLQAIIDESRRHSLFAIQAVVSSRIEAHGLQRAAAAGIPTHTVSPAEFPDRERYDAALGECLAPYQPGLIVLAGFMHILSGNFVNRYHGKLINIHPSLLPKYPGLGTHRRALAAGDSEHGCSVHFVTESLDGGPLIAQARVPILPGDTEQRLKARVQACEHRLYPQVLNWFAAGRVKLHDDRVLIDGLPSGHPRILDCSEDALT